jgi:alginate O-acetyltransferase complex protein AlgI
LQVYMDFSGYCDIAIGSARMLGISLTENFRWPMLSRNPIDLWSRWHITLSTWFRDYLFTALVGRRRPGTPRRLLNLVIVLTLMGLWHGPAWHFVLCGLAVGLAVAAYEGVYLVTGRSRAKPLFGRGWLSAALAVSLMNLFTLVLVLLFRSQSLADVRAVASGLCCGSWSFDPVVAVYGVAAVLLWAICVATGLLSGETRKELPLAAPLRAVLWFALLLALLYGAVDTHQQFIYFQF